MGRDPTARQSRVRELCAGCQQSGECDIDHLILKAAVLYYERLNTTSILPQRLESETCERLISLCRTALGDPVRRAVRGVTAAVTRPVESPMPPRVILNQVTTAGIWLAKIRGDTWRKLAKKGDTV
jgi:hypothetical protein